MILYRSRISNLIRVLGLRVGVDLSVASIFEFRGALDVMAVHVFIPNVYCDGS